MNHGPWLYGLNMNFENRRLSKSFRTDTNNIKGVIENSPWMFCRKILVRETEV